MMYYFDADIFKNHEIVNCEFRISSFDIKMNPLEAPALLEVVSFACRHGDMVVVHCRLSCWPAMAYLWSFGGRDDVM